MSRINPEMSAFNAAIIKLRNDLDSIDAREVMPGKIVKELYGALDQFRRLYEDITRLSPPELDDFNIVVSLRDWPLLQNAIVRFDRLQDDFNLRVCDLLTHYPDAFDYLEALCDDSYMLRDCQGDIFHRFDSTFPPHRHDKYKSTAHR